MTREQLLAKRKEEAKAKLKEASAKAAELKAAAAKASAETVPASDKPETVEETVPASDKPETVPASDKPETVPASDKPETVEEEIVFVYVNPTHDMFSGASLPKQCTIQQENDGWVMVNGNCEPTQSFDL